LGGERRANKTQKTFNDGIHATKGKKRTFSNTSPAAQNEGNYEGPATVMQNTKIKKRTEIETKKEEEREVRRGNSFFVSFSSIIRGSRADLNSSGAIEGELDPEHRNAASSFGEKREKESPGFKVE